jgi:hypothetical protein
MHASDPNERADRKAVSWDAVSRAKPVIRESLSMRFEYVDSSKSGVSLAHVLSADHIEVRQPCIDCINSAMLSGRKADAWERYFVAVVTEE